MTFPQVSQQDASPPIAAIYADIRRVSGLPVVNLIWRHFAALPGVLPWAWAAAAPLIGSTAMEAARTQMTTAMTLPPLVPRDRAEWHSVGIDDADLRQIISMNDAYIAADLSRLSMIPTPPGSTMKILRSLVFTAASMASLICSSLKL
jgi:hypothetical protein